MKRASLKFHPSAKVSDFFKPWSPRKKSSKLEDFFHTVAWTIISTICYYLPHKRISFWPRYLCMLGRPLCMLQQIFDIGEKINSEVLAQKKCYFNKHILFVKSMILLLFSVIRLHIMSLHKIFQNKRFSNFDFFQVSVENHYIYSKDWSVLFKVKFWP